MTVDGADAPAGSVRRQIREISAAKRRLIRGQCFCCDSDGSSVSEATTKAFSPSDARSNVLYVADVTVTKQPSNDAILTTLVHNYIESGRNHRRKFHQKIEEIEGHNGLKVFSYFWDARDGKEWLGWWFGPELGGNDSWARCSTAKTLKRAADGRAGLVELHRDKEV